MSSWNRNPSLFQAASSQTPSTKDAIQVVAKSALISCIAAYTAYGGFASSLLLALIPTRLRLIIELLLWGLSIVTGLRAVNTAYVWRSSRAAQAAQEKLGASQRKLLGLAPATPKPQPVVQRKPLLPAPAKGGALTPISPPQRFTATPYSAAATPVDTGAAVPDWARTPASTGITRPSPRSAYSAGLGTTPSAVATPEQLQSFLDRLAPEARTSHVSPAPGAGGALGAGAGGEFGSSVGASGAGGYGSQADYGYGSLSEQQESGPSPALPVGVELLKYRPSWLPRARAAGSGPVAGAATEAVSASTDDEAAEFLWGVLRAKREWMEVWTERLREWAASRVLQPLVGAVESAHIGPNALLAKYGQQTRLPSLPSILGGSMTGVGGSGLGGTSSSAAGNWLGFGGSAGGSGAGGAGGGQQQEIEAVLRHTQQVCQAMYNPMNPPQAADAQALAAGLVRYEQLLQLLRGRRPSDLLPPSPSGYLWSRVVALAQGTCMPSFNWNGGGAWAGRGWSADLPTDSLVVLYLFCAFLDAPGWQFDASGGGDGGEAGRGMPLFLGSLRSRPPQQYSAVLAYRPEKPGKGVDAILALHGNGGGAVGGGAGAGGAGGGLIGTGPPGSTLFCFLAEGRLLALQGYNAVFHAILAFLLFHQSKYNGALGRHYLQDAALGLSPVIEPPRAGANMAPNQSVFGWWFPPTHPKAE